MTSRAQSILLALALIPPTVTTGEVAVCSPTLFIEALEYPTDSFARPLAVGDFNGDTLPDVAAGANSPPTISVLLNDGDGGLESPILATLPNEVVALAAADLRGNGMTDLVVATYNGVMILLGHGDGTFEDPEFYYGDISNVSSVVVGAFDENAGPDVVLGSYFSSHVLSLLPGAGDGTFGEPILTDTPWPTVSLASGDFDGEGHPDVVASSGSSGYVILYPSIGDGTFGPASPFIAGPSLTGLTVGDFDADSNPDVAVGSSASVSVLLGNGSGNFEAAVLYSAHVDIGSLAAADLDQDGGLDIVAAQTSDFYNDSDQISVLSGVGDGSFEPGAPYSSGGTHGVAIADLNDDSLPDVVTSGGSVYVLLAAPGGVLLAVPNSHVPGPHTRNFARGDWNGDGRLDFAWVNGSEVTLIEGVEGGRFREAGTLPSPEFDPQPFGVAAGRFFGTWDLVISTYSEVFLYRGNGDGTFQDPVSIFNSFNLAAIDVADFDGQAGEDIVVGQGCCGSGVIVQLMNQGDGTFTPVETPFPEEIFDFLPAVLNSGPPPPGTGGTTDLVVVAQGGVWLLFSRFHGGGFDDTVSLPGHSGSSVAVGYFEGGLNDLLISSGSPSVSLYKNNGDRTFAPPIVIALASNGESVTSGYYNDDPEADFAVASGGNILVFLGLGDGHFLSPIVLPSEVNSSYLVTPAANNRTEDIYAIGESGIAAFRNARLRAWAPWVSVLTGSPAVLEVRASGYGELTYQWRRGGVPLSDGGPITGVHTRQLTIDPASFADAGSYDVVVTDACTSTMSNTAELAVEFADVPLESPFHDDINALARSGVTGGCGGADYCPTENVRRDQMAVFLLKSEHGSDYTPPACAGDFSDVPCPGPFTDWIEQLAAEGVTGGCGTGIYCPGQAVTRAQMAVFLLKTSEGSGYVPPPATGIFGDVPVGSFAADFIEDLYTRDITGGCSVDPLLYCPGSTVLRQQMATFLVKTFSP